MIRAVSLRGLLVLAILAIAAGQAAAQSATGGATLSGRVLLTPDDVPVHGATVIVVGTRRTASTDDEGRFTIANLPAGTFEVIVQREHLSADRQTVSLAPGATVEVAFALGLEALHENISVTASATGVSTTFDSFSSVMSLDSLELALSRGATLGETLAGQPGVAVRSFGPGSSRPIIRGFDGDRVLIMQDGVRTGDLSSQSGEHGVSLDPAGLERIEVVKGPATLVYGSNAIGGVVNAITPQEAFRATPFDGAIGGFSVDSGSNNGQAGGSGNIQYGKGPWTIWAGGGSRRSGDYSSPLGTVENSSTLLHNGRFGGGWTGAHTYVGVGANVERSRFGVPFAGELHGHHHDGEEQHEDDHDALEIDLLSNRREVRLDTGLRELSNAFVHNVKAVFASTRYDHDELEVEGGRQTVGTRFNNATDTLRLEVEQQRAGRLTGRIGAEWFSRRYDAQGEEALSPATRQRTVSAFAYEELDFGRTRLQFGGRFEHTRYRPGERPAGGHDHDELDAGHDHAEEEHGHDHEAPDARPRSFDAVSASIGLHRELGETSAFVVNATTAARAPAIEELYNFGPHVGNLAYEIGHPDLGVERTLGLDVSFRRRSGPLTGEINLFAYDISNFVYLDYTGEFIGVLREMEYRQGDSRFFGAEVSGEYEFGPDIHLSASVSSVRATLSETGEPLPRIPPVSGRIRLEIPWRDFSFDPEIVLTAPQRRTFRDESSTDGSALLNLGATWFIVRGHATHAITVSGRNLMNTEYRNHTSFLKDFAPEMGRTLTATYTVRFF
jgi:iron complex outermembrane receptor protein